MSQTESTPTIESGTITDFSLGKPFKVILFNDDHHNMLEVIAQVQKAVGCSPSQASAITLEAHEKGRAVVWTGHKERCEHIADVLEEIRLGTKVEPA